MTTSSSTLFLIPSIVDSAVCFIVRPQYDALGLPIRRVCAANSGWRRRPRGGHGRTSGALLHLRPEHQVHSHTPIY
jgi:hypothetical protein